MTKVYLIQSEEISQTYCNTLKYSDKSDIPYNIRTKT